MQATNSSRETTAKSWARNSSSEMASARMILPSDLKSRQRDLDGLPLVSSVGLFWCQAGAAAWLGELAQPSHRGLSHLVEQRLSHFT
jgi:hypothetical protein